jgi:hypothetical protein
MLSRLFTMFSAVFYHVYRSVCDEGMLSRGMAATTLVRRVTGEDLRSAFPGSTAVPLRRHPRPFTPTRTFRRSRRSVSRSLRARPPCVSAPQPGERRGGVALGGTIPRTKHEASGTWPSRPSPPCRCGIWQPLVPQLSRPPAERTIPQNVNLAAKQGS